MILFLHLLTNTHSKCTTAEAPFLVLMVLRVELVEVSYRMCIENVVSNHSCHVSDRDVLAVGREVFQSESLEEYVSNR